MILDSWIVTKIQGSTSVTSYSTYVFPEFIPETFKAPCFVYKTIGSDRNLKNKRRVISITSVHNDKVNMEKMNDTLYNLFDTSTAYIKASSSTLYIDSVTILENGVSGFDQENKYWFRVLDIGIWYRN